MTANEFASIKSHNLTVAKNEGHIQYWQNDNIYYFMIRIDKEETIAEAKSYEKFGASGISILTDQDFFGGNFEDILKVRNEIKIPILRKDFMIDEYQFYEAKSIGADVVLLIAACLSPNQVQEFTELSHELGLEVLLETHNLAELEVAHRIGAKIMGVNNRNLVTFETDINTSLELSTHFKEGPVYISESAIFTKEDAELVAPFFNGILVGTALMTAENVAEKVKELQIDKG